VEKKVALAALSALSQETRLDLYRLLVTVGPEGLPAGVIADRLGVLPSSLTFHLNHLAHAGLITQRRLSRQLIYSAEYRTMNGLLAPARLPDRELLRSGCRLCARLRSGRVLRLGECQNDCRLKETDIGRGRYQGNGAEQIRGYCDGRLG
jgi:ArsR family transcriptional regulator